jgi:hypothetical protein
LSYSSWTRDGEPLEGDRVIGKAHVVVLNLEAADSARVAQLDVFDSKRSLAQYLA